MQLLNIDVTKIPKEKIREVPGKGKYLDLVLFDNRCGTDDRGNDGFVAVGVTKEEREAGVRGPIIGNWKHVGKKPQAAGAKPPAVRPKPADPDLDTNDQDDIHF